MSQQSIQSQIMSVLLQAPATAPSLAARLAITAEQAERELERLFVSSKVECARGGIPVYRLARRVELPAS